MSFTKIGLLTILLIETTFGRIIPDQMSLNKKTKPEYSETSLYPLEIMTSKPKRIVRLKRNQDFTIDNEKGRNPKCETQFCCEVEFIWWCKMALQRYNSRFTYISG